MKKKVILLSLALCTFLFSCLIVPTKVDAKEPISVCSLSAPITEENIINVEIIDGELYIDVLTEFDPNQANIMSQIGPCPNTYKTITRSISRTQLINMRNEIEDSEYWTDLILGLLIGNVNVPAGILTSTLTSTNKSMVLTEIRDALDTINTSFTMSSKFQCEEGNLGSRGIVHRYRLVEFTIV